MRRGFSLLFVIVLLSSVVLTNRLLAGGDSDCIDHPTSEPSAQAFQSGDGWEDAVELARSYVDEGDCSAAWNVVWPWAKDGKPEARTWLATVAVFRGLLPPSPGDDNISRSRHLLILLVHAVPFSADWPKHLDEQVMMQFVRQLLAVESYYSIGGRDVIECLDETIELRECVDRAVEVGFVPDFGEYARELDAMSQWEFSHPASCLR
jgi:hypothetical protein